LTGKGKKIKSQQGKEEICHFYLLGIKLWAKRKTEAAIFLENFNVMNKMEKTPEIMTSLKLKYEKGLQFSLADLIIASLAVENDMVLITSDEVMFIINR